ncbi:MAG: IclR family transcriptional regulator [Burkholderiaceae bacterium]|nr:IclR family transcriptional regulator [Burkholderiaceae bacterium]
MTKPARQAAARKAGPRGVGKQPLGVQSVEQGVRVLAALMAIGKPAILQAVAEQAGMPPPKALRYLVSSCRTGVTVQNPATGAYWLGPFAVQLGLTALRRLNVVDMIAPELAAMRDTLQCTIGLSIWGDSGPTFIKVEEVDNVAVITVRVGAVMPIVSSATGRVYGAFKSPQLIEPMLHAELPTARLESSLRAPGRKPTLAAVQAMLAAVRKNGIARVTGEMNVGVHALAVPVFDHTGKIAAAISAMGGAGAFDASFDGPVAQLLLQRAGAFSARLGNQAGG